jgi:hypothetical protein
MRESKGERKRSRCKSKNRRSGQASQPAAKARLSSSHHDGVMPILVLVGWY